ncbi:Ca2+ regulator and membrane fusion protein Fig1-domain-containing protein [Apodospora peruviana]|uniref:Ca2+ regulator and membrane fusion protein Fig1-domain-containing protein n=1 Tax=Apodospora peruviana TaxID=516989 RepID=A0AAE0M0Z3_9PEZI|nr:Ca2+ regulator and membrane fusion protein Fig1-domain-containing protein [Apodospora peruviana]
MVYPVSYEHVLQSLCLVAIILSAVLVSGCASNGPLQNVFLLLLEYPTVHVRVGYFSLCVATYPNNWVCGADALPRDSLGVEDPWNLIGLADKFRHQVVFSGLVLASLVLMVILVVNLAAWPKWRTEAPDDDGSDGESQVSDHEVRKSPSRMIQVTGVLASILEDVFSLLAAAWQHAAAVSTVEAIRLLTSGEVDARAGTAATALVWVIFGICVIVAVMAAGLTMFSMILLAYAIDGSVSTTTD